MRHQQNDADVDLIDELRMRGWARANHIPADQRPESWHPIILDEMRRMDIDDALRAAPASIGSAYVPVVPTSVYMVHPGHTRMEPPLTRDSSLTERYVVG